MNEEELLAVVEGIAPVLKASVDQLAGRLSVAEGELESLRQVRSAEADQPEAVATLAALLVKRLKLERRAA